MYKILKITQLKSIIIVNRIVLSDGHDILIIVMLISCDLEQTRAYELHVAFVTRNLKLYRVQVMIMLIIHKFMCVFYEKYFD